MPKYPQVEENEPEEIKSLIEEVVSNDQIAEEVEEILDAPDLVGYDVYKYFEKTPNYLLHNLKTMSEVCKNLYEIRGGDDRSMDTFKLSIEIMEDMLVAYGRTLPIPDRVEEISENLPETP